LDFGSRSIRPNPTSSRIQRLAAASMRTCSHRPKRSFTMMMRSEFPPASSQTQPSPAPQRTARAWSYMAYQHHAKRHCIAPCCGVILCQCYIAASQKKAIAPPMCMRGEGRGDGRQWLAIECARRAVQGVNPLKLFSTALQHHFYWEKC